jgi:hypothetical protein
MQRSWLPRTLVLSAVLLAAACAKPSSEDPPPASPAARWCEETPVLIVTNNSGGDVEIYEARSSATRVVIAIVAPGRHEISVRAESGYSYGARLLGGKTTLASTGRPRVRDHSVTLNRECRER